MIDNESRSSSLSAVPSNFEERSDGHSITDVKGPKQLRQIKNANRKPRVKKTTLSKRIENLYDKKAQIRTKRVHERQKS